MKKLFSLIVAATVGIWLAIKFVPQVYLTTTGLHRIQGLILIGIVIGLINFFIKPILSLVTFPLKILTLGLAALIIDMLIIWVVDIVMPTLVIKGIVSLFWTTLFVWGGNIIVGHALRKAFTSNNN